MRLAFWGLVVFVVGFFRWPLSLHSFVLMGVKKSRIFFNNLYWNVGNPTKLAIILVVIVEAVRQLIFLKA